MALTCGIIVMQEDIFRVAGSPMVDNCLRGYNSCMFAYGQTGSGKTHTMLGDIDDLDCHPSHQRGVTPRIFEYLFATIQQVRFLLFDMVFFPFDSICLIDSFWVLYPPIIVRVDSSATPCWVKILWILQEVILREQEHLRFVCKCSFLEIYNEHITDLLDPSSTNLHVPFHAQNNTFPCQRSSESCYNF